MVSSVIVYDLDFVRSVVFPGETNSPLVIDSDTVLSSPVSTKLLQPIARRDFEIFEPLGCMEIKQFPSGESLHLPKAKHDFVVK